MGVFELTKLVSLYKAYCKGMLTAEIVKNEILDTKTEIDMVFYKTGENPKELTIYVEELEYLLFQVLQHDSKIS